MSSGRSGVFIVKFERISHIAPVFPLLTLVVVVNAANYLSKHELLCNTVSLISDAVVHFFVKIISYDHFGIVYKFCLKC